ncbi:MAG: tetratricopeptide repeat protein, partial [Anaerolineae bacterium]
MFEEYEDFEIRIGEGYEGEYPVEVDSPAGETSATFVLPFDERELDNILERTQFFDTDQDFLKEVGGKLYRALFTGSVQALYAQSLGMVGEERGLRLRLRLAPPELSVLPWEFLYDQERQEFIALSPQKPLTRYIACPERILPLQTRPPLRILVVTACPPDLPALDIDKEKRLLQEALGSLIERKAVQIEFLEKATMSQVVDKVREGYHVLHFIGHGILEEESGKGYLIFEDEWGGKNLIDGQTLGNVLKGTSVRLLFVNACESAKVTQRESSLGLAPALIEAGMPAVVAMQTEIPDETATILSREFYSALVDNYPVDAALAEARKVIWSELGTDNIDWAIPVLFMRAPDGRILDLRRPKSWQEVWLTPARLAAVALVVVAFILILFSAIPGVRQVLPTPVPTATPLAFAPATEEESLIVVAQFAGKGIDVTERIFNRLRDDLAAAEVPNTRIEQIGEVVKTAEEAKALGQVYNATLVIWGQYDDIGIRPNYGLTRAAEEIKQYKISEVLNLPSQPDRFVLYIAQGLPQEMAYFSAFTLGQVYFEQKEWDQALTLFNLALQNRPGGEKPQGLADVYFFRGRSYQEQYQWPEAIADFSQAIELDPEHIFAYNSRASVYRGAMGRYEDALADITRAIELDPQEPKPYGQRSLTYLELSKYEKALADANKAIELAPEEAYLYLNRGYIYRNMGELDKALADYNKAAELGTPDEKFYASRGSIHVAFREFDKAEADYKNGLELAPNDTDLWVNIGWMYYLEGKYQESIEASQRALELDPEELFARGNLALALLRIGEP